MQYLYDIFTVLFYNMASVFILYVPPNCNFKKESYLFYTLEYVTWTHKAKKYVNSIDVVFVF